MYNLLLEVTYETIFKILGCKRFKYKSSYVYINGQIRCLKNFQSTI